MTFTSAPAVDGLVSAAAQLGMDGVLVDALRHGVTAAAVGPVTAAPLLDLGITPIVPERFRMGALIRTVVEHLTLNGVQQVQTALGPLVVHGRVVTFAGETVTLARGPRAMLAALMSDPGAVLTRERLLDELPEAENEHALDMAVSRLRSALPDRHLVQTVVAAGTASTCDGFRHTLSRPDPTVEGRRLGRNARARPCDGWSGEVGADVDGAVLDPDAVGRQDDLGVVECGSGAEREHLLEQRRRDGRLAGPVADQAARHHGRPGVRVDVATA